MLGGGGGGGQLRCTVEDVQVAYGPIELLHGPSSGTLESVDCETSSAILNFLLKTSDPAARLHASCTNNLPQGGRDWFLFHRKFINCLLKNSKISKQGQFKH